MRRALYAHTLKPHLPRRRSRYDNPLSADCEPSFSSRVYQVFDSTCRPSCLNSTSQSLSRRPLSTPSQARRKDAQQSFRLRPAMCKLRSGKSKRRPPQPLRFRSPIGVVPERDSSKSPTRNWSMPLVAIGREQRRVSSEATREKSACPSDIPPPRVVDATVWLQFQLSCMPVARPIVCPMASVAAPDAMPLTVRASNWFAVCPIDAVQESGPLRFVPKARPPRH